MITELLADVVLALKSKNKKAIDKAYRNLDRLGMDKMTVDILLRDKEVQKQIIDELKERSKA